MKHIFTRSSQFFLSNGIAWHFWFPIFSISTRAITDLFSWQFVGIVTWSCVTCNLPCNKSYCTWLWECGMLEIEVKLNILCSNNQSVLSTNIRKEIILLLWEVVSHKLQPFSAFCPLFDLLVLANANLFGLMSTPSFSGSLCMIDRFKAVVLVSNIFM